jgi:hypothetical protein
MTPSNDIRTYTVSKVICENGANVVRRSDEIYPVRTATASL